MIHRCDADGCNVRFDGATALGYFMTDDGDTFCCMECAVREMGEQVELEWDEEGNAIEFNFFWTDDVGQDEDPKILGCITMADGRILELYENEYDNDDSILGMYTDDPTHIFNYYDILDGRIFINGKEYILESYIGS